MNFLKEYGIDDKTIESIEDSYDSSTLNNFITDEKNVGDVINYLRNKNIFVIDELLINRIDLFMMDKENIDRHFNECKIDNIINLINEDYTMIDYI